MGRTSYFLKAIAEHLKRRNRTEQPGKTRQTVCAARASARPGFNPTPSPLLPFPGSRTPRAHARSRAPAQNCNTPSRARPPLAAAVPYGGCAVVSRRQRKRSTKPDVPSSRLGNCVSVPDSNASFLDTACLAVAHDARASLFCAVPWCAGVVLYMPSNVPNILCATPERKACLLFFVSLVMSVLGVPSPSS